MRLALAALTWLIGCGEDTDRRFKYQDEESAVDTATPCGTEEDCNAGSDWTCKAPGEEICPECTDPVRDCESDEDCEELKYCRNYEIPCSCSGSSSTCTTICRGDQDCGTGEECDIPTGKCLPASCLDGYGCPPGTECTGVGGDHGCQSIACSLDADCGEGLYCVDQACYTRQGQCWPDAE